MNEALQRNHSVIITIVKKGKAKKVCETAKKAGAEGGTTIISKGTSVKEFQKIFGLFLDEEREVVFTVVKHEIEDIVFNEIINKCKLNKPGSGITFIIDLKKVDGIVHLLKGGL
ncbi:P-II family nitrogen regulator [Candidatus Contubernalis alkaliaceticus]|uniref:P-II family nitrogen regulator n=1 Tax=Candidatus Contubernalis alkaliaceticus TaxID=338645 RepID=UPI001F4C3D41|nr:P-II family nitrogen regulator [Candidatus Contubernalis alkalaceticus]UNC92299.1 P-II family nitrogen regulator [Candidatus Contubernalis alkalaceticus]